MQGGQEVGALTQGWCIYPLVPPETSYSTLAFNDHLVRPVGASSHCITRTTSVMGMSVLGEQETVEHGKQGTAFEWYCRTKVTAFGIAPCLASWVHWLHAHLLRTGPSCTDGIWNGLENGVDCGGPFCDRCGMFAARRSTDCGAATPAERCPAD